MTPSLDAIVAPRSEGPVRVAASARSRARVGTLAVVMALVFALAAALRAWAAVWDQGMVWPDEIFQTLEQAHRFAFKWGVVPWEFRDGARSWVFPGLVGLAWKGVAKLGVKRALTLVCTAKLGMAALSLWGVYAGARLAQRLAGDRAMLLALVFGGLCPPLVIFGSRCTTETASAPLIVVAALLIETHPRPRRAALAGALVALAVLFRYQNGLVAAAFALTLLLRARWKELAAYLAGAAPVAAAGAAVDWVTWGKPFKPLMVYMKFNTTGGADRWGIYPFTFFGEHLATTVGVSYALLVLGFLVASRRAPTLAFVVVIFLFAHSLVPHKELRFMVPILPLAVSLGAAGLGEILDGRNRGARPTYALAALCGGQLLWSLKAPTFGDLGYKTDTAVIWHANEGYYRAALEASAKPDLCGIIYVDNPHAWTAGYTYLHREVPVFFDTSPRNLPAANYVVGGPAEKLPPEWRKLGDFRDYALWRRDGDCGPTPPGWNLDQL